MPIEDIAEKANKSAGEGLQTLQKRSISLQGKACRHTEKANKSTREGLQTLQKRSISLQGKACRLCREGQ